MKTGKAPSTSLQGREDSPKHYQPHRGPDNKWRFTTPTGKVDGFLNRSDALRIAANTERDDRHEAATKKGFIAAVLRKHFGIELQTAPEQ